MKSSHPLLNLPLLAMTGLVGFTFSSAQAHDPDEHHYYDHVRAAEARHHTHHDREHAERAVDRAYATGDPRDFFHAMRDRAHAKRAGHIAHDAEDHAWGYSDRHRY